MAYTYFVKKCGKAYDVDFESFTPEVQNSIINAGLGRIINDLVAGTKTQADSRAAVSKKLEAWANGEVRTSTSRESDPVRKRALELASAAVKKSAVFIVWLQENGLKQGSKEAQAKLAEAAKDQISRNEGENKWMAQAAIDVAAAQSLGDDGLDIQL